MDPLYLPELNTGPFACDAAAFCFVSADIGAHSEIAGATKLDDGGQFHQRAEHKANSGIRPMDVSGDGRMELLRYFSDEKPDYAAGTRFWEVLAWNGTEFTSQGCRPPPAAKPVPVVRSARQNAPSVA